MLNEYCSNEVVPCDSMAHPIECDPKENPFNVQYVRSSGVATGESLLLFDLGTTHVAVSGCQTTGNVLGDLWVTYEIELKKPLVASNVTTNVVSANRIISDSLSPTAIYGPTYNLLFGAPIGALNNTLTFPRGCIGDFAIMVWISGGSLALTNGSLGLTGCSRINYPTEDNSWLRALAGSSVVVLFAAIRISDPTVNATFTFDTGGTGTLTSTRVVVTEIA
jgi:hypothetical protein